MGTVEKNQPQHAENLTLPDDSIRQRATNALRILAIDMVEKANSGHPGLPMGAAPMAYVLWQNHLRHNPKNPLWPDRDRFILSPGHGSALLYGLLHLSGYDLPMDDLKAFRQWKSRAPGHPEWTHTPGVEATTGPLGQGCAIAVGMAIAERNLAYRFNRKDFSPVDHHTFAIVSDGDLMEGISAEAGSLAGHLGLGKLVFLYDSNDVSLDGPTSLTFSTENVAQRYESYGWHVVEVADGDTNFEALDKAIGQAKEETLRPSLIIVKTTIGYGSPNKSGTASAHGSPLGPAESVLAKKALGGDPEKSFHVDPESLDHWRRAVDRGQKLEEAWNQNFEAYRKLHPDLAQQWNESYEGLLPAGWDSDLPRFEPGDMLATRVASGMTLNALAAKIPWLIGGDADLSVSTNTKLKEEKSFDGKTGEGRNIHYGVREHAMAAAANGMLYHGGVRPFSATFFIFSDYMRPSLRLAAMGKLPSLYIWTHDSIGVGEDGPTHQPIEQLMSLRAMPGFTLIRPADANETVAAWRWALSQAPGPVGFVLSRQKLPVIDGSRLDLSEGVSRGAYILSDPPKGHKPQALIIASGSEVSVALGAQEICKDGGIFVRVVSMPSWDIFENQSQEYKDLVLPPDMGARVSVEAGTTFGWTRWIGSAGIAVGINRFGESAPGPTNMEKFGFTPERVATAVMELLDSKNESAL